MKRSEMLKLINDRLNRNFMDMTRGYFTTQQISEFILGDIEDAGMLPPEHLFTSGERADHYLNEWESE